MFASLAGVAAQTARRRARAWPRWARATSSVTGNLKFDVDDAADARARWAASCARGSAQRGRSWLAASTRDGEEALILDALARARAAGAQR